MFNIYEPNNNQNYIINQPIYINNNSQNNNYLSNENPNENTSIIPKSFDCIYSNLPLHQPQYVQKEIEINYKYRRYIPAFIVICFFGEYISTVLIVLTQDEKSKLNLIINIIVSIILLILLIILFRLSYKITIIFRINEKNIIFQENSISINLKQEVKQFNEVFIIRINKNNQGNCFKIGVMDINRDITILDINGIGRCCICCNSKDSFHDIDCFIFKCNCILEKCHGLTKTFSSFNKKNSNNLKVPYFKYEKM